jgi:hypothetical protein
MIKLYCIKSRGVVGDTTSWNYNVRCQSKEECHRLLSREEQKILNHKDFFLKRSIQGVSKFANSEFRAL